VRAAHRVRSGRRAAAGTPDGGGCPCDLGELCCDGACVAPATDDLHCGGCGIACDAGELCASGTCAPRCEAPLLFCDGLCIDTSSDPDNCGRCGRVCPSGICRDGLCGPASAGHLVVVGHDYTRTRAGMDRVVGNAVFLASGDPVRVVVYDGRADPASVGGVVDAIGRVARDLGRSWTRISATASDVPFQLASADVLLIHAQHGASDDELRTLGTDWSRAMRGFVESGRTIVLLEAPADNAGTFQILEAAALFTATGRIEVSGDDVDVVAPGDAVALGVPIRYRAERRSVRFDTLEATTVVRHADGPVVVHRVVPPR
jgi:hypothetical protein